MSGWVNLSANAQITTSDGGTGNIPVSGTVFLNGNCQNGGGFVSGNVFLNGSGAVYNNGRYVGNAQLSGNAFINQYVSGGFAWINQSVYLTGEYSAN